MTSEKTRGKNREKKR